MSAVRLIVATATTVLLLVSAQMVSSQEENPSIFNGNSNYDFPTLDECSESSLALSKYGPEDELTPCILQSIRDFDNNVDSTFNDNTSEITLVQVTPSICHNHRDGAVTSVRLLNQDNGGKGIAIGYNRHHYVKFRLISIVGGNPNNIGNDAYSAIHEIILNSTMGHVATAHFILGSCSWAAVADKSVALEHQTIVISQVGPPGFYLGVETNPYVFGIHVNSDTYPLPALSALTFDLAAKSIPTSSQQVRVLYRDRSEFFYSTCQSVIDAAYEKGFDVTETLYNPDDDEDGNGVVNSQDIPFLDKLADELCPANTKNDDGSDQLPPAIFACVGNGEADAVLNRMRSKSCRPSLSWFTTATWDWAGDNPDVIPYFQGGGQWHKDFVYSDQFFNTGQEVIDYGLEKYGYVGNYDHVVSYSMPILISKLIESFFRVKDLPDVAGTFQDRYEQLRRAFVNINAQTIFGPVQFNEYQRNNGRGAAGMQWIPSSSISSTSEAAKSDFVLGCVSPSDQANTAIIIPSPSGEACNPGSYISQTLIETESGLLEGKCAACPLDSYTEEENTSMQCTACPSGTGTVFLEGASSCVKFNENLVGRLKIIGFVLVGVSWAMAFGFIAWVNIFRDDPVVKMSQPEFLLLICVGSLISSSSIIPWSLAEAGVEEDETSASRYCVAWPWLYSIGFVLMYSSLTAKSLRLHRIADASRNMQRKAVTAKQMYSIVILFLTIDIVILTAWTVVDPMTWSRKEMSTSIVDTGVITVETSGRCQSNNVWHFLGPIIAVHAFLMIITNALLWKVRNISDRYQEQKYVAIASVYICELLLLGIPVLFAVQDSASARYIIVTGVIFFTDTGVLALIFLPKIKFQRLGLPEGVTVAQSLRLHSRRESQNEKQSHASKSNTRSDPQAAAVSNVDSADATPVGQHRSMSDSWLYETENVTQT
uniref:G-protein coupled receptors family 3 profile domain-containing protein n=1 Tax=Odontella aurita TaxID=265563 RepID=A0A7S4K6M6_9STRA|mmetsp:Transcript_62862/g.185668  ORF Transcript_62862/g.185668 Transcript_62862/m.185668 type:complete len:936 (+) Transcript_62862:240-3047(+)